MRPQFDNHVYSNSGKPYPYNKDKVLAREGDWYLRRTSHPEAKWASYIHHNVEKNIVQQNPWHNGKAPVPLMYLKKIGCEWSDIPVSGNRCTLCLNTIPKGLMGLWTLHNWDALQTRPPGAQ